MSLKMFVLRIIDLKNGFTQIYNRRKLAPVFIILRPFSQIINIDRIIL